MPKHRNEVAVQVTRSLHATEASIDAALAQVARFVGELPAARQEAHFGACVGQAAITNAIAAMAAINQAREAMIAAHEALADVRDEFRLQPTNFGPDKNAPVMPFGRLRTVDAA